MEEETKKQPDDIKSVEDSQVSGNEDHHETQEIRKEADKQHDKHHSDKPHSEHHGKHTDKHPEKHHNCSHDHHEHQHHEHHEARHGSKLGGAFILFTVILLLSTIASSYFLYGINIGDEVTGAVVADPTAPDDPSPADAPTKEVSVIAISDKGCEKCADVQDFIDALEMNGVTVGDTEVVDYKDADELIEKYGLDKVPAILISDDLEGYDFGQAVIAAGYLPVDGYYVIPSKAPYRETDTGDVRGMLTLTMLEDESCDECYNVSLHKDILESIGLVFSEAASLDISSTEGKALVDKYKITKVPTVVVSGDVDAYESFDQVWADVGTIEEGAYVFRELDGFQEPYKNLETGEVVVPMTI